LQLAVTLDAHIMRPMLLLISPVAAWVLMFFVFLALSAVRGFPQTARLQKLTRSPYLPRVILEFGYWMMDAPANVCVRLGITPNMITTLSLILSLGGAILVGGGHFFAGGWTLLVAFMCDAWDGIVARKTNASSDAGEFFDATVDRYSDIFAFVGLMYYYRDDFYVWLLAAAALVGSTLTSYTRAKGESVGIDPNVGYMQRHERAVYLGGACAIGPIVAHYSERGVAHPRYFLVVAVLVLLALLSNVTAVWRARFVLGGLHARVSP
jgi:CDP-diacylglycerol---glycerol-3-phosphate 3-phosphatidyltransferase